MTEDDSLHPIEHYREIAQLAERMLCAARRDDWDDVRRQERTIRHVADCLGRSRTTRKLDGDGQRERARIMRRLLTVDADVRRLANPAGGRLDALLTVRRKRD